MAYIKNREYDSPEYCSCGCMTTVILDVNNIIIPLCDECYEDLKNSIAEYENIIHCRNCEYWLPSMYGMRYDGTCAFKYRESGKDPSELKEEEYGYMFGTAFSDTCNHAIRKEIKNEN